MLGYRLQGLNRLRKNCDQTANTASAGAKAQHIFNCLRHD
jgi:hypothetical protein